MCFSYKIQYENQKERLSQTTLIVFAIAMLKWDSNELDFHMIINIDIDVMKGRFTVIIGDLE